jgi:SH3 domain protein
MLKLILIISSIVFSLFSYPLLAQEIGNQDKDLLYVTDQLRLSLYEKASSQSRVIKLLSSGDQLAVEELSGAYALVTTPDGNKGWVKRGFLLTTPTASILLEQEQAKTRDLESEIEKLGNSKMVIDQYEKDMDLMTEKINNLMLKNERTAATVVALELELVQKQEMDDKLADLEPMEESEQPPAEILWQTALVYWKIIVPLLLGIMLFTFIVSKSIVETRIKNKFHGIKIW